MQPTFQIGLSDDRAHVDHELTVKTEWMCHIQIWTTTTGLHTDLEEVASKKLQEVLAP